MLDLTLEALIARVEGAIADGRFAEARSALEEAGRRFGPTPVLDELRRRVDEVETIAVEPQFRALVRQAQEAIHKAEYRAAIGALKRAQGLKPEDRETQVLLAETEKAERRRRRAVEREQAVLQKAGEIGDLLGRDELAAGRAELESAGIEHGKHAALTSLWQRLENLEDGARRQRIDELAERARSLLAGDNLQGAREEAERVLRFDAGHRQAREIAERARTALERQAGRRHHERAVEAARHDVERLIAAGELPQASRRVRQAIEELGREEIFGELEGRLDKARDDLQFRQRIEWAERRANEAAGLIEEAALLSFKGAYGEAIERLEAARQLDPSHPETRGKLKTATLARERQIAERRRAEERAAQTRAAAYTWEQAFGFPFRGRGPAAFWGGLALLLALDALSLLPAVGTVFTALRSLVPLAAGAFVLDVVRATAAGGNRLPAWELAPGRRWAAGLLTVLAIAATALAPLALWVAVRPWHGGLGEESGPLGWLLAAVLLWLASAVLVLGCGAGAFGWRRAWSFRSHFRALAIGGLDVLIAIDALFALAVVDLLGRLALAPVLPWLAVLLVAAVEVYGLLLVPHLIGIAVRRHRLELTAV